MVESCVGATLYILNAHAVRFFNAFQLSRLIAKVVRRLTTLVGSEFMRIQKSRARLTYVFLLTTNLIKAQEFE